MCLFSLQKLIEPACLNAPVLKKVKQNMPSPFAMQMPMQLMVPAAMSMPRLNPTPGMLAAGQIQRPASAYDLSSEFGQMSMERRRGSGDGPIPSRLNESKRINSGAKES